jgi:diguanylate cyclase (GGDEF)-like protein
MRDFLTSQLDFIFFLYGFSFLILGYTCATIARIGQRLSAWKILGAFAFVHGACEWMDLVALSVIDTPTFALARTILMAISFAVLLEFGRRDLPKLDQKTPGPWIYAPLAGILATAWFMGGAPALNAAARYAIGLPGALLAGCVFMLKARKTADAPKFWMTGIAVSFFLYGAFAGAIPAPANFWPANVINQAQFLETTGVPIQLLRCLLASFLSFAIWTIAGRMLAQEIASERYWAYQRRQFLWTVTAATLIFIGGWGLTQALGASHERNVSLQAKSSVALLISEIDASTNPPKIMSHTLAGLPAMIAFVQDPKQADTVEVQAALRLSVQASGASQGYVLDRADNIIARFGDPTPLNEGEIQRAAVRDHLDVGDIVTADWVNFGAPIRAKNGAVIGHVLLRTKLDTLERSLPSLPHLYFVVDGLNVIRATNRPGARGKVLWPSLRPHPGAVPAPTVLPQQVRKSGWLMVDGRRNYLLRHKIGREGWSLVVMLPSTAIVASRALGIIVTLLISVTWLTYLLGREHSERDAVLLDRRLQLQKLAQDLGRKATTDTLTGLSNRLKLNETLEAEIQRAQRYETPLSLLIFDVDHFKRINDTYGHPVGDGVLARLSTLLREGLRATDLAARWGGEEFAIICPHADEQTAFQVAEKLRASIAATRFETVGEVHCSFGVAAFEPGDTLETLVARADAALYAAKQAGRNQVARAVSRPAPSRRRTDPGLRAAGNGQAASQ